MSPPLDLNLLLKLRALLQTRSVTLAAKRLGISQPAMSRSLADLRRLLGDPLLVRTRGGMILTRRAEELAGPLQAWLDQGLGFIAPETFDPSRLVRRFQIVATDFGVASVIRPALPALMREAPGAALDVKAYSGDLPARLASGEIDLATSGFDPDPLLVHARKLFRDEFVCVTRTGHPLALRPNGSVTLPELLAWPHVTISVNEEDVDPAARGLRQRGLERHIVATTPYFSAARDLIVATDAAAIVPARVASGYAADPRLTVFAAPPELGGFDYWLLWHTRGHRDPALRWLIDLLSREAAGGPSGAGSGGFHLEAAE